MLKFCLGIRLCVHRVNLVICIKLVNYGFVQYNTIHVQLKFDIALPPYACQTQTCTFTPRRRICNCNRPTEHCERGTRAATVSPPTPSIYIHRPSPKKWMNSHNDHSPKFKYQCSPLAYRATNSFNAKTYWAVQGNTQIMECIMFVNVRKYSPWMYTFSVNASVRLPASACKCLPLSKSTHALFHTKVLAVRLFIAFNVEQTVSFPQLLCAIRTLGDRRWLAVSNQHMTHWQDRTLFARRTRNAIVTRVTCAAQTTAHR